MRPLEPRTQSGAAPLSRMQQRLVFIQELSPASPLYQVPTAIRLRGPIDATLLERALHELTLRHEVLLSRISLRGSAPSQIVDRELVIPLERIDLAHGSTEERETALGELLQRRANTPMVLTEGPLIQFALITMATDDNVLFFMPHHVVWDGASLDIFLRELDELYGALSRGEPTQLPPLPIQYADFAAWHEEYVDSDALDDEKEFWRERLAGNLPALDLPSDRPRPPRMTYAGATSWWRLDQREVATLTELGRGVGATFYMVLLAAYVALLHRYAGHREILVGTPVRGRSWRRTQGLIGMFVNTLVLRVPIDHDRSFIGLLKGVRDVCESSFDHPNMPLDVLVRELGLPRDPSRAPLAQAFLSFRDVRDVKQSLLGLPATEIPLHASFETQDLTLWATQTSDGVTGVLTFATELFDQATMDGFVAHYQRLLSEAAQHATAPLGSLRIVGDDELARLDSFNATTVPFREDVCVHTLIAEQANRTPDATAIIDGRKDVDGSITYRQLDERTNQLARHLRELGVGRDVRVGLAVERSIDLVIAQVAVLKAGGAYVPLDPSYPIERLAQMVEDAGMVVLITQSAIEASLPKGAGVRVLLDTDASTIGEHATSPLEDGPDMAASAESLAYVIYTSGSTGKPKGVLVPHRPLVNFIASMKKVPGIGPGDVVLAVTTLSFDIAVFDTLTALATGAMIVMASGPMTSDGDLLRDAIGAYGVTLLNATPATWRLLLAAGWEGGSSLRAISAGEALPKDLAIELVKRCGAVWDLYGPTETTVWSTYWKAEAPVERILIGRPIDNTEVHILDAFGSRCPVGVVGEIVIAGAGVTNGYSNHEELTNERFAPDPFGARRASRMYRTGDLGRWLVSGELEYLGRRDTQIKLRGFRIELGEIEAVLATHEAIAEAVASIFDDDPQNPMLVAYVVTHPRGTWTATELRKLVRSKLPPYMVPQHVVELGKLPLTPAGKVDRRQLPPPFGLPDLERPFVAPKTDTERMLAELCAELLRIERVSASDNFFDLGGHSMLSLTLIARIERQTGVRLNPRVLLTSSIAQVAALLPASSSSTSPSLGSTPSSVARRWEDDEPPTEKMPLSRRLLDRVGKKLFGR